MHKDRPSLSDVWLRRDASLKMEDISKSMHNLFKIDIYRDKHSKPPLSRESVNDQRKK